MNKRLYPRIWSNIYYHLDELRKEITRAAEKIVKDYPVKNVLDYGCGSRPYQSILESFNITYKGADLEDNKQADYFIGENGVKGVENGSFDMILSNQVLEHVPNPTAYLQECYRILNANGVMLITVPNYWIYHPVPNDYSRWTSQGLRKILEDNGFEIQYFEGSMSVVSVSIQMIQDKIIRFFPKVIREIVIVYCQLWVILADKLSSAESRRIDAATYIAIVKKK